MTTPTSGKAAAGTSKTLWGVALAVIAALGLFGFLGLRTTSDQPEVAVAPPAVTETEPQAVVEPMVDGVAETSPTADATLVAEATPAADATPVADAAPSAVAPEQEILAEVRETIQPSFDIVRLDAEGRAVIAGRSAPGSNVSLRLDGDEIRNTSADRSGNFVAMLQIAPSDRPRVLSLVAVLGDETPVAGAETAMIAPFAIAGPVLADATPAEDAAMPPTGAEPPLGDTAAADAASGDAATSMAAEADTSPAEAPTIVVAGSEGLRVLQGNAEGDATPSGDVALQLDAISYDAAGAVTLAGRGSASAALRVAVDDRVVQTAQTDDAGQFSIDLSDVAPGTYVLRLEQLDTAGQVLDVLETPFRREDPARIRDNPMMADPGSSVITVQRGFTLWGIAEANFGSGFLYVQIFQENRSAIRDPNLIYPGQIFALPDMPRTGSAP